MPAVDQTTSKPFLQLKAKEAIFKYKEDNEEKTASGWDTSFVSVKMVAKKGNEQHQIPPQYAYLFEFSDMQIELNYDSQFAHTLLNVIAANPMPSGMTMNLSVYKNQKGYTTLSIKDAAFGNFLPVKFPYDPATNTVPGVPRPVQKGIDEATGKPKWDFFERNQFWMNIWQNEICPTLGISGEIPRHPELCARWKGAAERGKLQNASGNNFMQIAKTKLLNPFDLAEVMSVFGVIVPTPTQNAAPAPKPATPTTTPANNAAAPDDDNNDNEGGMDDGLPF